MNTMQSTESMIARRVRGGYNAAQSRDLLAQIRREHGTTTITAALAYHGFTGAVDTRWSDPENGVIEAVIDVDRFRITVEEIGYPS